MKIRFRILACTLMISMSAQSVQAQSAATNSLAASGARGRTTRLTGTQSQFTSNISQPNLPASYLSTLSRRSGPQAANGLPVCRLDSFVHEAGGRAELIYGDEGTNGPPPIEGFNQENRIDSGIYGDRDAGLTTGHQGRLPSSWGRDEFIGGPEYYR